MKLDPYLTPYTEPIDISTDSALQDISQFRVGPGRSRTSLPLPGGPTLPAPSRRRRHSPDMYSLYICTRVLFTTFKQLHLTGRQVDSPAGAVRAGWWQSPSLHLYPNVWFGPCPFSAVRTRDEQLPGPLGWSQPRCPEHPKGAAVRGGWL